MSTLVSFIPFDQLHGDETDVYPPSILGVKAKIFKNEEGYEVHVELADSTVAGIGVHRPCSTYDEAVTLASGVLRGIPLGYLAKVLKGEEPEDTEETDSNFPNENESNEEDTTSDSQKSQS